MTRRFRVRRFRAHERARDLQTRGSSAELTSRLEIASAPPRAPAPDAEVRSGPRRAGARSAACGCAAGSRPGEAGTRSERAFNTPDATPSLDDDAGDEG